MPPAGTHHALATRWINTSINLAKKIPLGTLASSKTQHLVSSMTNHSARHIPSGTFKICVDNKQDQPRPPYIATGTQ